MTDNDFEQILRQIGAGETTNARLMELLYAELHAMAGSIMRSENSDHTLQPTALVHEAFLRLIDAQKAGKQGRLHFLAAAAVTMRRVLVDHARSSSAQKRGGADSRQRITLRAVIDTSDDQPSEEETDIVALNTALSELADLQSRHASIFELRFFGGMSQEQIAEHLGVSRPTVTRDLALSRAWLKRRIRQLQS